MLQQHGFDAPTCCTCRATASPQRIRSGWCCRRAAG
jgi:hypothetical protein